MITNFLKVTHQAGGLQTRGGSIDSSHSRHRLVVVDEPLSADQQFWRIRYQILLTEDKVRVQNFIIIIILLLFQPVRCIFLFT